MVIQIDDVVVWERIAFEKFKDLVDQMNFVFLLKK